MKIRLTAKNKVEDVFSITEVNGKYKVQFKEGGIKYTYSKDKIELLSDNSASPDQRHELIVYKYSAPCYQCRNPFEILTYITFDGTSENLQFPWDKHRLNREKSFEASLLHMEDESIEYYPVSVIGNIPKFDKLLLDKFPGQIQADYSQTVKKVYPMNICPHCGSKKGSFFVYKDINQIIFQMKKLEIAEVLSI